MPSNATSNIIDGARIGSHGAGRKYIDVTDDVPAPKRKPSRKCPVCAKRRVLGTRGVCRQCHVLVMYLDAIDIALTIHALTHAGFRVSTALTAIRKALEEPCPPSTPTSPLSPPSPRSSAGSPSTDSRKPEPTP